MATEPDEVQDLSAWYADFLDRMRKSELGSRIALSDLRPVFVDCRWRGSRRAFAVRPGSRFGRWIESRRSAVLGE